MTQEHEPGYLQDVIFPQKRGEKPREVFDVNDYVTKKDRDAMSEELEEVWRRGGLEFAKFFEMAKSMKIIFPDFLLDGSLSEALYDEIRSHVVREKKSIPQTPFTLTAYGAAMRILFPERAESFGTHYRKEMVAASVLLGETFVRMKQWGAFLGLMRDTYIAFPESKQELLLDEVNFQEILGYLEDVRPLDARYAAAAKILFPEAVRAHARFFSEIQQSLHDMIRVVAQGPIKAGIRVIDKPIRSPRALAELVAYAKILASPEVRVDKDGIHFEDAKPTFTKEPIPPMPEERKF